MKKICIVFNSTENTKRFPELLKTLKNSGITKKEYDIFDYVVINEKPIEWNDYKLLLIHHTDLMKHEQIFYESIENYKGKIVYFSGGIYNFKEINDNEYSINYNFFIKGLIGFIKNFLENKQIDLSFFKMSDKDKKDLKMILRQSKHHKKLKEYNYNEIVRFLKSVKPHGTFLFVDDDLPDHLIDTSSNLTMCNKFQSVVDFLNSSKVDIALLDIELDQDDKSGFDLIKLILSKNPECKIVMLSGYDNFDIAYKSYLHGAKHFISKENFSFEYFKSIVKLIDLEDAPFIVGKSVKTLKMFEYLNFYSQFRDDVMIYGENGTGKELVARSLYKLGEYSGEMITKNCAGIPETLFESEMFGYKDVAFTGALKGGKKSPFEEAENGIVFLDEIGELPLTQQVKLLRVIQERQVIHLGTSSSTKFNSRLIFATNKDLFEETKLKNFRVDLFYRISGALINVPPLRERKDDIELLAAYFTSRFFLRNSQFKNIAPSVSLHKSSVNRLLDYSFPGNIREFEKIINQSLMNMIIENKKVLTIKLPDLKINFLNNQTGIETVINLLENGTFTAKGLKKELKVKVIQYLINNGKSNKDIAKLFNINAQSVRNLRYELRT